MGRGLRITTLLVGIATIPAFVMFLVVSASLYASRIAEVRSDIDDRGRLLAAALADSSRYGVVSGNEPALTQMLLRIQATDTSISALQILDEQGRLIASSGSARGESMASYDHPIRAQAIEVDLLGSGSAPQGIADGKPRASDGAVLGHARVLMSAEPLLKAKRKSLAIAGSIVLVSAMLSAILGIALSQRLRRSLGAVMAALRSIRRGDFAVTLPRGRAGELGELQTAIVDMTRELSASRLELEAKVAQRTGELQAAVNALRAADEDKRRLIAHGNMLVEEERRRIAGEIHDQLNASLISVRLIAASLKSGAGEPPSASEVDEAAERISKATEALYESARRIVKRLRPEVLDALGLRSALSEMTRQLDQTHASCRFELRCDVTLPPLSDQLSITVYRIVQEALSNVVKHAYASRVLVSVGTAAEGRVLTVSIADNGRGIDPAPGSGRGMGVAGMRERALGVGGTLRVEPNPTGGTIVDAEIPLEGPETSATPTPP